MAGPDSGGRRAQLPGPILKWAGGKTQLLPAILPALPERVKTYYEPFVGGGAVFFAMARARRFQRAVIADKNPEVINLYSVVRDQLADLKVALAPHAAKASNPDWFYHVRGWRPHDLSPADRAARILFLNRTCFNGLYRVNRKGEFNVPFGRYKNPRVLDEPRLDAASEVLQGVSIRCDDFAEVVKAARTGDAVYFDPPYAPVSPSASFNTYHAEAFGPEAQTRLVEVYRGCWQRGAVALLSNSDCSLTRELYRDLDVHTVQATRAINSASDRRGHINELLVLGVRRRRKAGDSRSGRTMASRVRAKGGS